MENKRNTAFIAILSTFFVLTFSLWFLIKPKLEFSEQENRYLEKFPKFSFEGLQKGTYTEKLESYLSDHFPGRDTFMGMKTVAEKTIGKTEINGVYLGKDGYLLQNYDKPENSEKIAKILNEFANKLNYANIDFLLAPTSIGINTDKLPPFATPYSQKEAIKEFYQMLSINKINVYDVLKTGNEKYQMYYRTDHHWTSYGAYYAYVEYCKSNQLKPLDLSDFEIKTVTKDFYGTMYSKTNDYLVKPDEIQIFVPKNSQYKVNYVYNKKETDTLYEPSYLGKKDKYSYFLDNLHPLIEITNEDLHNGKELAVIKDSYANSMIPFLINHYEKIHVIDPRRYGLSISDYIKEHKNIKDILILYNMITIEDDLDILGLH